MSQHKYTKEYSVMNYEKTILELLERIKRLEEKVDILEEKCNIKYMESDNMKKNYSNLTQKARKYIAEKKMIAEAEGLKDITLLCNDIQKALGVTQRPASICRAMYDSMNTNDEIVFAPSKGLSTTLKIKYHLD